MNNTAQAQNIILQTALGLQSTAHYCSTSQNHNQYFSKCSYWKSAATAIYFVHGKQVLDFFRGTHTSSWDFLEVNAEFSEHWNRLSRQLWSLHHWKYSEFDYFPLYPALANPGRARDDVTSRSDFWHQPFYEIMNKSHTTLFPACIPEIPDLYPLGFIHNLLFLPHTNISPHTHNHTLHSSIPVNLQYPKPKSLGLFLAPCYLPDLPLPILCSKS